MELIRERVTVPGCCCCMPLLHSHLTDSCSYVRKNTLLAAKGGCICKCTPLTPPKSVTDTNITVVSLSEKPIYSTAYAQSVLFSYV